MWLNAGEEKRIEWRLDRILPRSATERANPLGKQRMSLDKRVAGVVSGYLVCLHAHFRGRFRRAVQATSMRGQWLPCPSGYEDRRSHVKSEIALHTVFPSRNPETCCTRDTSRVRCGGIQADTRLEAVIGDGESQSPIVSPWMENPGQTTRIR